MGSNRGEGRRPDWLANLLAAVVVLGIVGSGVLAMSSQLSQFRWEHAARAAFDARSGTSAAVRPGSGPPSSETHTLDRVAGALIVAAVLIARRRRRRQRAVVEHVKWVGKSQREAAERLSAIIRADRLAR